MRLEDLIKLNPKLVLKKGVPAPFIEMAALPTNEKFIHEIGQRKAVGSGAKFQNGDTLFARITPCLENGKGGYVSGLPDGVVGQGSTEFIVLRARKKSDEQFAYYLSRFQKFRNFAEKGMEGTSGRQRVTWQTLADFELPDLSEMQRAALGEVLGSLDDKIELNRQMNETLEEMARALFRDWFIDFGPTRRQMDGATDPAAILGHAFPDDKAAALAPLFLARFAEGGLPDKWIKKPVGELSEIVGGGTPNTKTREFWEGGTHLWATPRDLSKLSGVFIRVTERQLTDAGLEKVSSGLSPKGSVLMSSRAPIGYLAIASEPVAVNQGIIVLRPTKAFPTYFAKLWCEANMETIEANANGSTFQEISKKNFKPILAMVPSAEVLEAFSRKTDLLFGKIKANEHENQTLAQIRDLLLPKLMSGKIQLKDAPMVQDILDGYLQEP